MSDYVFYSNDDCIKRLQDTFKYFISMKIYYESERSPTKEEYEYFFDLWKGSIELKITNEDLGIHEDV